MSMEQIHPNLNADVYRNLEQNIVSNKNLEVILVHKDDSLLIGASNMTDRYWRGSIWYFDNPVTFNLNEPTASIGSESGVSSATYLDKHDKFITGEDSGVIQIFKLVLESETETQVLESGGYTCQHDDTISSLATFPNNSQVVSAGLDSCIKIWDVSEMVTIYSFNQAHTKEVTCVDVQRTNNDVFFSTSTDCEALLWDVRKSSPASSLILKDCSLSAIACNPNDENIVAIGSSDGKISIIDIRNKQESPVHEFIALPREIHRLLFSPKKPNFLAACCDGVDVKVFDTMNNYSTIYENKEHKDFVRGLAWNKSGLLTCSWDNTVLKHTISQE